MTKYCDLCNRPIRTAFVFIPLLIRRGTKVEKSATDFALCEQCAKTLCDSTYDTMTRCFDPDLAMARIQNELDENTRLEQENDDILYGLINR